MDRKILIVGPYLNRKGGVAQYYRILLSTGMLDVDYMEYGHPDEQRKSLYQQVLDLFSYIGNIKKYKCIHLNPSMDKRSLLRDMFYAILIKLSQKNLIISFMGWDNQVYKKLLNTFMKKKLFALIVNHASHITVPALFFSDKLLQLGITKKVTLIYPPFDSQLLDSNKVQKKFDGRLGIIFMARIEESKGIFKLMETLELLHEKRPESFTYTICGDGSQLNLLKTIAAKKNIPITFTGNIYDVARKKELFRRNHIFLYPSEHAEGFPLVLAEVLMNGLILITSDSGGIGGVVDDKNGFVLLKDVSANVFFEAILEMVDKSTNELEKISLYNMQFAEKNFSPYSISEQLNFIYKNSI